MLPDNGSGQTFWVHGPTGGAEYNAARKGFGDHRTALGGGG